MTDWDDIDPGTHPATRKQRRALHRLGVARTVVSLCDKDQATRLIALLVEILSTAEDKCEEHPKQ